MNGQKHYSKVYVSVDVMVMPTGEMRPVTVNWPDGRVFDIDRILDVRPAPALEVGGVGIRYIVRIRGAERKLFFEHSCDEKDVCPGRWFIVSEK